MPNVKPALFVRIRLGIDLCQRALVVEHALCLGECHAVLLPIRNRLLSVVLVEPDHFHIIVPTICAYMRFGPPGIVVCRSLLSADVQRRNPARQKLIIRVRKPCCPNQVSKRRCIGKLPDGGRQIRVRFT